MINDIYNWLQMSNNRTVYLKSHLFQVKDESLFGVMDKTLHLLQMGFTEEEVSSVIDKAGK